VRPGSGPRTESEMRYKGYTGVVEFDEESGALFGRVVGLRDGITFQGDSVAEVIQAFHDSVDDYLEFCAERGESPEKPYSGQFVLRIEPQLHRAISHAAEARGVSLNRLIEENLETAFAAGESAVDVVSEMQTAATPGKKPSGRRPRPKSAAKEEPAPQTVPEPKAPRKRRLSKSGKG
jgi:predicted HicB family RNase H-like nuclease